VKGSKGFALSGVWGETPRIMCEVFTTVV